MPKCNLFSPYLLSESPPLEVRPPSLLGGIYAAGRTSPRSGPEGRTLYAASLSGGGIDTIRQVVKPINAPCAGRVRVDAMVTGRVAHIILLAVWV